MAKDITKKMTKEMGLRIKLIRAGVNLDECKPLLTTSRTITVLPSRDLIPIPVQEVDWSIPTS